MHYLLAELHRNYVRTSNPNPDQSRALADAAFVLAMSAPPSMMMRNAVHQLWAAFGNSLPPFR